ncbi:MAG: hypothetical protein V3T17_17300 [Pseudomonadales bacterium]
MQLDSVRILKIIGELSVIVGGILLSFYLQDLRQDEKKKAYKDQLIAELIVASEQDLDYINLIRENLNQCVISVDTLIDDMLDGKRELSKREVAEHYLVVSQKMYTSYFPQNGTYEQLIASGSLELVKSTNFRKVLLDNYTHLLTRNNALSRTLDDHYLILTGTFGPFITVVPTEMKGQGFIYSNKKVKSFSVNDTFFNSQAHLSQLIETKNLISNYLDLLDRFSESYEKLLIYYKDEEKNSFL